MAHTSSFSEKKVEQKAEMFSIAILNPKQERRIAYQSLYSFDD